MEGAQGVCVPATLWMCTWRARRVCEALNPWRAHRVYESPQHCGCAHRGRTGCASPHNILEARMEDAQGA